jgi:hypothetical protein
VTGQNGLGQRKNLFRNLANCVRKTIAKFSETVLTHSPKTAIGFYKESVIASGGNVSGVKRSSLIFEAPVDGRAYTFGFDKSTVLTLALQK